VWLWEATRPLAWEVAYATGVAIKKKKGREGGRTEERKKEKGRQTLG